MTEKETIKFLKRVLLSGDNPRGEEAEINLKWGLKEYMKEQEHKLLLDYHRFLVKTLTLDISEVWVTEYLEKNRNK
jgi:hypothetical protein